MLIGKELVDQFTLEFGGVSCNCFREKYTGKKFDMWDTGDSAIYKAEMKDKCAKMAGTVAGWVVKILEKDDSRLPVKGME